MAAAALPAESAGAAIARAAQRLEAAGIDTARREARLLLSEAMGVAESRLVGWPESPLDADARRRFDAFIERRAAREPVAHLLGRREFWSLSFATGPATLTPRPDSETLVDAALAHLQPADGAHRVLDLGTGTGCLLLAVLSERPNAHGCGVDISDQALATATTNAGALGLAGRCAFRRGTWGVGIEERFDLVLSNPPYIPSGDIADLEPEVAHHEPRAALDGGADGLDAYRAIAADAARLLEPGGALVLEVGHGQADAVAALLNAAGMVVCERRRDLAGIERCIVARSSVEKQQ